ncbi:MAG: hypothetical protein VW258_11485 [Thalassolituus sp.]
MLDALTVSIYSVIALQFAHAALHYRTRNRRAVLAFGLMVVVFVLCAVSGYLDNIVTMPHWLHEGLHVWLIVVSLMFAARNQTLVIIQALKDD